MTAEIAVMNKMAVALAADSAVTIHRGKKIYNSANKLFMLSRHHPVGIMIYGNSEIMGYPWEVLVKSYRDKLGDKSFDTISDYGEDFICWLREKLKQAPSINHDMYYKQIIQDAFWEILKNLADKGAELSKADDAELEKYFRKSLILVHRQWKDAETLVGVPDNTEAFIKKHCNKIIAETADLLFKDFNIDTMCLKKLHEVATMCFIKNRWLPSHTGLVIAGFGDKQDYPSVVDYKIEGLINNWLKYIKVKDCSIDCKRSSWILPFAQRDVVATFVEGIEPQFQETIYRILGQLLEKRIEVIIRELSKNGVQFDPKSFTIVRSILDSNMNETLEDLIEEIKNYKYKMNITPVLDAINALPIDELASTAEALVNLTSFKRRVSMDQETVGGPVDVAVISKGDGFIWIKRKHYFDLDKNQHYLVNNYFVGPYREKGGGAGEEKAQ